MAQTTTGTTGTQAPATTMAPATTSSTAVSPGQQQLPDTHVLGSDLIGASVTNTAGDSIGKTSDLLVTKDSKTVDAVVIDVGGFLGIGSKSVAIPLDKLTIGARPDEGVKTAMTKEELEALPAFEGRKSDEPAATGRTDTAPSKGSTTSGG
jgi:sporulation protein YlmC with PRC-barrel domain